LGSCFARFFLYFWKSLIFQVVIDEIQAGDNEAAGKRMEEIGNIAVLEATTEAEHLAGAIIDGEAIPKKAVRDAAHIAIAAVNDIDYHFDMELQTLGKCPNHSQDIGNMQCTRI